MHQKFPFVKEISRPRRLWSGECSPCFAGIQGADGGRVRACATCAPQGYEVVWAWQRKTRSGRLDSGISFSVMTNQRCDFAANL